MKIANAYITARVPETMRAELKRIAELERRSISQVMLLLLESALAAKNGGGAKAKVSK